MRLILMRHAKSDWSSGVTRDHDRPLNARGLRAARAMGDWLRAQGYLPDRVLCSTATRTRETLDGLRIDAPVSFETGLYHASPDTMLRILHEANGQNVLMIGHNPGIAELAEALVATPPDHPRFFDYPTGATLVVDFQAADWSAVAAGRGASVDFVVPRDLE
ncbi:phosphohistidine phosphatase [Lutimaribacter pacificus]|uniref:Phosphohistidine phosphatase n=1 Tax=Lutimaribacter pacificus TaxID=391948 RepID=A0A1H0KW99_9RHOB|nr:histidine phosphatase family protein [Lutimaribacter pacificus]SDO60219.1 phosphohistidine phosphatase [Lutimaribacter pacificus]SHK73288.1 phosphohistidine phosphatase [Lutimaribacter pacificus]